MSIQPILNGNRWQLSDIKPSGPEPVQIVISNQSQSVHFAGCQGEITFIISGASKTAAVSLEGCRGISILVSIGVLSNIELINCSKIKIQLDSLVPSINIDGSEAITIYQMAEISEAKKTIYYTSKSSEVNIMFKGNKEDDEMREIALPEQFKSCFDSQDHMKTEPVMHASA